MSFPHSHGSWRSHPEHHFRLTQPQLQDKALHFTRCGSAPRLIYISGRIGWNGPRGGKITHGLQDIVYAHGRQQAMVRGLSFGPMGRNFDQNPKGTAKTQRGTDFRQEGQDGPLRFILCHGGCGCCGGCCKRCTHRERSWIAAMSLVHQNRTGRRGT